MRSVTPVHFGHTGTSLIEVLVAAFVTSVGIVGVLELQKHFIKSGNIANARLIAVQLVRDKMDSFTNVDDFARLSSGADPGEIIVNNVSFTRSWTMSEKYYNQGTGSWDPVSEGERAKQKIMKVTISWTDNKGKTQGVAQDQVFSSLSLHDRGGAIDLLSQRSQPKVVAITATTPDNPAFSLTDDSFVHTPAQYNLVDTAKPRPTVYSFENNHYVQFDTVTYDLNSQIQDLQDFVTLNCSCIFNGNGAGATPTRLRIAERGNSLSIDKTSGYHLSKDTGLAVGNKQPALCDKCCNDHHDDDASHVKYVLGTNGGNHHHYNASLSTETSGNYLEACRLRRVDGFYQVVPDWHLVDFIIMPQSYFDDANNVAAYVSYVKGVVKAYMTGQTLPDKSALPSRAMSVTPGHYQLVSRGIYVDKASLNTTDLATITGYINSRVDWLAFVPFYDIDLSLLSDWQSRDNSVVRVTNEAINTQVDVLDDDYGTYSHGRIEAIASNDTRVIIATARIDNTGITGSGAIAANTTQLSDQLSVSVTSNSSNANSIFFIVNCTSAQQSACNVNATKNVTLTLAPDNISCTYSSQKGQDAASVTCNALANWSGTIKLSKAGYSFTPAVLRFVLNGGSSAQPAAVLMTEQP